MRFWAVPGWQLCLISGAMESDRGGDACLEEFDGRANVAKATSVALRAVTKKPRCGSVSSMNWLTAFTSDITVALVEDGALFGPK